METFINLPVAEVRCFFCCCSPLLSFFNLSLGVFFQGPHLTMYADQVKVTHTRETSADGKEEIRFFTIFLFESYSDSLKVRFCIYFINSELPN